MKNLLVFLFFGILTSLGCQSESKPTASADKSTVVTSVPVSTPAPVATAPAESVATDEKGIADEAPSVPAAPARTAESIKNTETKVDPTPAEERKPKKVKEVLAKTKDDIDAKIAAEKEKLAAEVAKIEAEQKKKAEEKAAELKEEATEKIETAKTNIKENIGKVKEITDNVSFSHQVFDDLLGKHVSSAGKVNYSGFKQDQGKLQEYLNQLEGQAIESSWSEDKKLAYWINAYNAYTIDLIVKNYPLKSIKDLEGGKPWDKSFINLNGQTLSLNNIENDIIRPTFKDARIHFAVNCAAKSCPPLMNKAWTEDNIQRELEKRTNAFINNSSYNTISAETAKVSKIFDWYAVDFGNLNNYLAKYNKSVSSATKVSYMDYDWGLNE